ncbi:MAG TPA: GNAT family N-acetyltransferase [Herpetosiphonaceae bacterium]
MAVIETERLALRELTLDDAPFILDLLNDPDFIRHIGDKGVRSLDDARRYLSDGPLASYARFGYGLWLAELRGGAPIGLCGLVRRDTLPDPDIGYALLPAYRAASYASEAAAAVMAHAFGALGLPRLLAIVSPANAGSSRVLEKIGMRGAGTIAQGGETLLLYAADSTAARWPKVLVGG